MSEVEAADGLALSLTLSLSPCGACCESLSSSPFKTNREKGMDQPVGCQLDPRSASTYVSVSLRGRGRGSIEPTSSNSTY